MPLDCSSLIARLEAQTEGKRAGRAYKKLCDVLSIPDSEITRWKFNEYDYYSAEKVGMPITARGLFTLGKDRILVRGYNKFFNMNEVRTTKKEFLKTQLKGPYYATVKENGYLVSMAGYKGQLVVTSKNSSGSSSTNDVGRNYAAKAREWALKHLRDAGKTEKDFADLLESNDWTAVGEVCDDEFEEHVLPYDPEIAGIYSNGSNLNAEIFKTEPPSKVMEVSNAFGFRRTDFVEFDDYEKLTEFLEEGQKSGKYGTRDVEGFVIRCKLKDDDRDFFWKFKFEEPYMMYRTWREVVKAYLADGQLAAMKRATRSKHRLSSVRFSEFASRYSSANPDFANRSKLQNLGIIELRTRFFEDLKNNSSAEADKSEEAVESTLLGLDISTKKYSIVTVATSGCGKSTVAEILTYIMHNSWGHHKNDQMKASRGKSKWTQLQNSIMEDFLSGKDVVILDRNNSGRQEREQIFEQFNILGNEFGFDMHYICSNYLPDGPSQATKMLTRKRVYSRGDNHETVQLSSSSEKAIDGIMLQFENRFQAVNTQLKPDNEFELVIDSQAGESVNNVLNIVETMRAKYPNLDIPLSTEEQVQGVFEDIINKQAEQQYPILKKTSDSKKKSKPIGNKEVSNGDKSSENSGASGRGLTSAKTIKKLNYFGLRIGTAEAERLKELVSQYVPQSTLEGIDVQDTFHVTLAHKNSHPNVFKKRMVNFGSTLSVSPVTPGHWDVEGELGKVVITKLAWSPVAVAFKVDVDGCANNIAHITIGTKEGTPRKDSVKSFNGDFIKEGLTVQSVDFATHITLENQQMFVSK